MTYYKQCTLTRGSTSEVVFIPETFAVMNKYLRIGDENGWQVKSIGANRVEGAYLKEHEREYLNHRKITDI